MPPPPSLEAEPAHCRPRTGPPKSPPVGGEATSTTGERKPKAERSYRVPWAELLKKVFAIDVLDCPKCSGRMKLIAFITGAGTARQILEHLELPTTGPPTAKAERMGSDEREPAPEYDLVDPSWEE